MEQPKNLTIKETILVTGGLGYIGSHTCVELQEKYNLVIVDNLSNSSIAMLEKIETITNSKIIFYQVDLLNKDKLEKIFSLHLPQYVIHFAGLKSVSESVTKPLHYYQNNIVSTLNLLELMEKYNCDNLIFSSSATVYGHSSSPLLESSQIGVGILCPYGQTKFMIEHILSDMCTSNSKLHIISLRYFNPIGAHESGLLYDNPNGIPNNIMPYIVSTAIQNNTNTHLNNVYNELKIFGNDYDTHDGTCLRDYIHVVDLAKGHICALNKINNNVGYNTYNLGTGIPVSVLELVNTFATVNNVKVPFVITNRRKGDLPISYCDPTKANRELDWKTEKSLADACVDCWKRVVMLN